MKNLILIFLGVSLSFSILAQQPAAPKGKLKPFPKIEHKNRTESKGFAATKSSDFAEDFETGATTWSIGGLWQVGQPTSGPMGAYSNLNCAATNLSGNYNNYVNDWLISPAISLPSDVTYISLKFFEWFELESDYDYGIVKISEDNGVTWNQIDIRTGFSEWRETIIDITAYKGKNVLFAFNLTSDGSVTYSGWYIDAISIESDGVIGPDASIMSFNSQNFPQIYMNISVNT
ncbi:MAG: choice-of-anchor J domain-containing protein, partial [Methanococcaceae archaeon]